MGASRLATASPRDHSDTPLATGRVVREAPHLLPFASERGLLQDRRRPASLTRARDAGKNRVVRVQRIAREQLKERLDRGDVPTLLDVRLKYPYEHSTLKLPGALRAAPDTVGSASIPRDKEIVVYDSDPGEIVAARFAQDLLRQGYQVSVLKGGLPDWVTANYPTETKEAVRTAPPEQKSLKG